MARITRSDFQDITINSVGAASIYPSNVHVIGVTGLVSKVALSFFRFSHTWPDDVDILLVGPTGQKVIVLSDVGGTTDGSNLTITLDDTAANFLPDEGPLTSGTFKPTNIGSDDAFPLPAPAGPYGSTLSAFNGLDPNGVWSLFVVDDASQDSGLIDDGWDLFIYVVTTVTVMNDGDADNFLTVGSPLTYTIAFNYDINSTTVSAADFQNAGSAAISIGTITETSPGVFTVQVTPSSPGTLQLRIPSSATINDATGDSLVVPFTDDEILTVSNIIFGTSGNDLLTGTPAVDTMSGLAGNDSISGLASNDSLNGGIGNDYLNGGLGADTMVGGPGNDIYVRDNAADVITETSTLATEIDTVQSSVTYALGANLERLTLTGAAGINGTGNALNNILTGNGAANVLNGGLGNDTLTGGLGNDLLIGAAGSDRLTSGTPNDADIFRFNNITERIDILTDFDRVNSGAIAGDDRDRIQVSNAGFNPTGGASDLVNGLLPAARLVNGVAGLGALSGFRYFQGTGQLFFDSNGGTHDVGVGSLLLATLTNLPTFASMAGSITVI